MTPNDIEILIHCHVCPAPHPRANAPAVVESMYEMRDAGLLNYVGLVDGVPVYETTPKGAAHIENLCNLPCPVEKWVLPDWFNGQSARP